MTRPHDLWRSELANPAPESQRHQRTTDPFLMLGFWMIDSARTKPAWPVAIWMNDGKDSAFWQIGLNLKNTTEHADEFAEFTQSSWLKCVAVSETDWHKAIDTGKWPDGRPARHFDANEKLGLDEIPTTPASAGGNMPEGEDVDQFHAQVTEKITYQLEKLKELGPLDTLDKANTAAGIRDTLRLLWKQGDGRRQQEGAPWHDKLYAIETKWGRFLRDAKDAATKIFNDIDAFKTAEKTRLQAEERKRQDEERRRIAEETRIKLAAETAERARIAASMQMEPEPEPSAEDIAAQAEEIAAEAVAEQAASAAPIEAPRVGTAHGRGVSKAKTRKGKVTDALALATHLITGEDADMLDYLQKRADAAARAKITLPGMVIAGDE